MSVGITNSLVLNSIYLKGDDVRDLLDPVVGQHLDELVRQPHVRPLADEILKERVVLVLLRTDQLLLLVLLRLFRRCLGGEGSCEFSNKPT